MSTQSFTSQEYFRSLTIPHASLMIGQILMAGIIYFFANAEKEQVTGVAATGQLWVYIVGGATIFGVLLSAQLFGNQIKKLKKAQRLDEKMMGYRSALIVRYTVLEAPSFLAIVGYFLTNNLLLLIFTGMILFLFLMYRPTKAGMVSDLELSPAEQAQLDDPNTPGTSSNEEA